MTTYRSYNPRSSMTIFNCVVCGYGSLVRSNFKFGFGNRKPFCRQNPKCLKAWNDDNYQYHCDMVRAERV